MEDFNAYPTPNCVDLDSLKKVCVVKITDVPMAKSAAKILMTGTVFAVLTKIVSVQNHLLHTGDMVSVLRRRNVSPRANLLSQIQHHTSHPCK